MWRKILRSETVQIRKENKNDMHKVHGTVEN